MASKGKQKISEFSESLSQGGAVLILSSDDGRASQAEKELLLALGAAEEMPRVWNGSELKQDDLYSIGEALSTPSLFSSLHLLKIKRVESLKADLQAALLKAIPSEPSGGLLILRAQKLPSNNRLKKHFQKLGALIEFKALTGEALEQWLKEELDDRGIASDRPAREALIEVGDSDPDRIRKNAEHVALYAEKPKITRKLVFSIFASVPDPNEFAALDLLAQSDVGKIEEYLQEILSSGTNAFLFLNLLARLFRQLIKIRVGLEKRLTPAQIAEKLSLKPWIVNKNISIAKAYPLSKLERCLRAVVRADSQLKNRSLGEELILSEVMHSLRA